MTFSLIDIDKAMDKRERTFKAIRLNPVDFAHFQKVLLDLGAPEPPTKWMSGNHAKPVVPDESVPEGEVWFEEHPESYFRLRSGGEESK